jgi:hypothetical protein
VELDVYSERDEWKRNGYDDGDGYDRAVT